MTDRINAFIVVLDDDIRDDAIKPTLTALRMVKGVISVTPNVGDFNDVLARSRVRQEVQTEFWEFYKHMRDKLT